MADRHEHLAIARTEHANPRRRRRGRGVGAPADPRAHAARLETELEAHRAPPAGEVPGFDPRRLLKLTIEGPSDRLVGIPGMSVVSQERKNVTVLFATEEALREFQRRLQLVKAGRNATRKEVLWAVQHFDDVTPDDRTGPALRAEGRPARQPFQVDVELWPLELNPERTKMLEAFRVWCRTNHVRILDEVNNAAVVLVRVEADETGLDGLLRMRDVRQIDLPPRYQFDFELVSVDVDALGSVGAPPANAPGVVVLDAGLATGHPVLAPAMGDSQAFTEREEPTTEGLAHGTFVGSLALYGDVQRCLDERSFQPTLRLFSGRVWDEGAEAPGAFLENRIAEAVAYFNRQYACRVFVLAFGDERKVYRGGHVDRLAGTLDTLAREHGVLFVLSAGNFRGNEGGPEDWRQEYPEYLLRDEGRIIDPAPALNALTVGSVARYEVSRQTARYPRDAAHQPIARAEEPAPFTRSGPGPLNAIKPDLVEYGGNRYVDIRMSDVPLSAGRELGEVGASSAFAAGNVFALDVGTSVSAPRVAHVAARLLGKYPRFSTDLVRALLVAHAEVPQAARARLGEGDEKVRRLLGYGRPREELSLFSSERCVTMVAEERLEPNQHHFFELPLPDDLFSKPLRRRRRVTVALAHSPRVRRTRLEYKECALSIRIVRAENLDTVARAYRRLRAHEEEPPLPEKGFSPSPQFRNGGTVQCATHYHEQIDERLRAKPYFIVVTNAAPAWGASEEAEPYALAVVIEDISATEVQLYSQIREILRARVRARART